MGQNIINLLVVDDEWDTQHYEQLLSTTSDYYFIIKHIDFTHQRIEKELSPNLDAIVMAYREPLKDPLSLLLAIKVFSLSRDMQLPVILLTASAAQEVNLDVIKSGITDYLAKDGLSSEQLQTALVNAVGKFQVLETLEQEQSKLVLMAYHDALTKLPNRYAFEQAATRMLSGAKRYQRTLAVMILDLDNFKLINDSMGHDVGDLLLVETAKRIKSIIRGEDLFARLGGDEFAIILETDNKPQSAAMVTSKIIAAFGKEFKFGSYVTQVSPSIGIASYPTAATEIPELIKYADLALYEAKSAGGNNFQFFTDALNQEYIKRQQISVALHQAIQHDEFHLVFQPAVRLDDHQLIGAEVLLRWESSTLGAVEPNVFIPIAEESGLIPAIGEWVLNAACEHYFQWQQQQKLPGDFKLSINISSLQLEKSDFLQRVNHIITEYQIAANSMSFELNENAMMQYSDSANDILDKISTLGIGLVIDNFGSGLSCLSKLIRLNIDKLKIDLSFVNDMESNLSHQKLVRAVTSLGQALGVSVLAEGIETADHLRLLKEAGCHYGQGFYISKPIPSEDFLLLLKDSAKSVTAKPLA